MKTRASTHRRQSQFRLALITATIVAPCAMAVTCYVNHEPRECPSTQTIASGGESCLGNYVSGGPIQRVGLGTVNDKIDTIAVGVCTYTCTAPSGATITKSVHTSQWSWGTCPGSGSGS